jgi:hypothetical protein
MRRSHSHKGSSPACCLTEAYVTIRTYHKKRNVRDHNKKGDT